MNDDLITRIKDLPEGTREAAAYEQLAPDTDRADFRELWLRERLGLGKPVERGKAVVEDVNRGDAEDD